MENEAPETLSAGLEPEGTNVFQEINRHLLIVAEAAAALVDAGICPEARVIGVGLPTFGGGSLYQYLSRSDELSGRAAASALVERIIAVESNGDSNAKNSRSS